MRYYNLTDNYNAFDRYLKEGGMAGSYLYKDQEAKDAYPTMRIARTRCEEYQYEGVRIVDVADWLGAD